jgi:hypothetical protein
MDLSRTYGALLRLYPVDYQLSFAAEMRLAFEEAAAEPRGRARSVLARFALAEFRALVASVLAEWIAKWTSDRSIRGRCLPDPRTMRPPGVSKPEHYLSR